MKKLLIIFCFGLTLAACKKKYDDVSQVVNASYPTISFTGSKFYSIKVNDPVPAIQATAYDSTLHESYDVDYDPSVIDNTLPGLYVVPMTATNKFGYVGSDVVYVAVTDIPDAYDLSGTYVRAATGAEAHITEVANGLYETDDVGGAPTLPITAYFVQVDDTLLDLPPQPTDVGTLYTVNSTVRDIAGDTVISWAVRNAFFGTQQRNFVKQ